MDSACKYFDHFDRCALLSFIRRLLAFYLLGFGIGFAFLQQLGYSLSFFPETSPLETLTTVHTTENEQSGYGILWPTGRRLLFQGYT